MSQEQLIEFRNSAIHGTGGFARTAIANETLLVEYIGRKIDKEESSRQCELDNPYIFTLDDQFDLDGNVDWNPARLLNHSCSPNAEAQDIGGKIWIVASRNIQPGEEVTFNYNYDLVDYKDHPCCCGAPNCVGYIIAEELFAEINKDAVQTP